MMHLRVSSGTFSLLGLNKSSLNVSPTTLYFLLGKRCCAHCHYCAQQEIGHDFLARVHWPQVTLGTIIPRLPSTTARRICIQTLKYPKVVNDLVHLSDLLRIYGLPLSVCINPLPRRDMKRLKKAGVERIGIGLDCATPKLFRILKKMVGTWDDYLLSIQAAQEIFGKVTVHLIVGLGENDYDILSLIDRFHNDNISTALFAHTPCGLFLPPPSLERYRAIQLARHLIIHKKSTVQDMDFVNGRLVSLLFPVKYTQVHHCFLTSGCPDCNRPFYNEPVSGPLYNYPRFLTPNEKTQSLQDVSSYLEQGKILTKRFI